MKRALVAIKRVIDHNVPVRLNDTGTDVMRDGVKHSINPFDEIALEEALRLRSAGIIDEVCIVSIGQADCEQQLRTGLALGADKAMLINADEIPEPLAVARTLLRLCERLEPLVVLLGKQAIDSDNGQTAQMLAALWQRPQATYISSLQISDDVATVNREIDSGLETLELRLPAVLSTDLRLNTPRFAKLPDILKAKKKPIEQIDISELTEPAARQLKVTALSMPPARAAGIRVADVDELIAQLRERNCL